MMASTAGGPDRIPQSPAIVFNEAINRRDLDALDRLMTDDHTFIDSDGNALAGKVEVLKAWEGFFEAFPDYRNEWSKVIPTGRTLTAVGRSICSTEPALDGPAIWTARVGSEQVSEWRVYEDTPENRAHLGIAENRDWRRSRAKRPAGGVLPAVPVSQPVTASAHRTAGRNLLTRRRMARRSPSAAE